MCTDNSSKSKGKMFFMPMSYTEVKPFNSLLFAENPGRLKFQQCFLTPCFAFYLHSIRSLNFEAIRSVLLSALKWFSSQKKDPSPVPAPGRGVADGLGSRRSDGAPGVRPDWQLQRSPDNHNVSLTREQHRMRLLDKPHPYLYWGHFSLALGRRFPQSNAVPI